MSVKTYWVSSVVVILSGLAFFVAASVSLSPPGACLVGMAIGSAMSNIGNHLYNRTWPK